jgi:hypothetical protein
MRKRQRGGATDKVLEAKENVTLDLLKVLVKLADAQGLNQKMMKTADASSIAKSMGSLFEAVQSLDVVQSLEMRRKVQEIIHPANAAQKTLSSVLETMQLYPDKESQTNLDSASRKFIQSLTVLNPFVELLKQNPNMNIVEIAKAATLSVDEETFFTTTKGLTISAQDFDTIVKAYSSFKNLPYADAREILKEPKFAEYRAAIALFGHLYKNNKQDMKNLKEMGELDEYIVNFAGYGKIAIDIKHGAFNTLIVTPLVIAATPFLAMAKGVQMGYNAVKAASAATMKVVKSRTQLEQANATLKRSSQSSTQKPPAT